ncbi:MAG: hypothetical protein ABSA97_04280 [Verrucomicrobiia bacterium]
MPTEKSIKELVDMGLAGQKPSTYYRTVHPELFSDTKSLDKPILSKALLQFHLEQLTVNKKEIEFEEFCRRLAEREICPNLLPQTGPTGGGDSKADAATYPVAGTLALRRYWAGHAAPANEDWAFAFSCKKKWLDKIKNDVAGIAAAPRKFTKAYFITNQPVMDKKRAEVEAQLTAAHKIDVRILDRTWIVTKVLDNHHEEMAMETLGLDTGMQQERQPGPRDARRQKKLDDLLGKLRNPDPALPNDYALAQDYLAAAKLAAALERPRDEVDGLFLKARSVALTTGYVGLIIRCHYHHAWRTYFYFDDAAETNRIYEEIEKYLPQIGDTEECELFSNLCSILQVAHITCFHRIPEEKLNARITALRQKLEVFVADESRPNNALHAESLLHMWNLYDARYERGTAEQTFKALRKCLKRSAGLGTYPLLQFADTWQMLGEVFCDIPAYVELQKDIQHTLAKRCGETEAGQRQLTFAAQLLDKGKNDEALRQFSEARLNLAKAETMDGSVHAALGAAVVYHSMGLNWASRTETLSAAHIALHSLDHFHEYPVRGFYVAMRMAWLELELGRVGPFLAWRSFAHGLIRELESLKYDTNKFAEQLTIQEGCFGCLLLRVSSDEVAELRDLTDCLSRLGLDVARIALLCATGRQTTLLDESPTAIPKGTEDLENLIAKWKAQPASGQLPEHLCDEMRTVCTFSTKLFGVTYRIRCRNKLGPLLFTENLLGVLESALALVKWENFAFIVDEVKIYVDEDDVGSNPPPLKLEHFGSAKEQKIIWKPDMLEWMRLNRAEFCDYMLGFLLQLLIATTIDPIKDLKKELETLKAEKSFERALATSPTSMAILDLLGKDKYDLNNWINSAPTQTV